MLLGLATSLNREDRLCRQILVHSTEGNAYEIRAQLILETLGDQTL